MDLAAIAAHLEGLDQAPGPAAHRFDAGPALASRVAVLPSAFNPPTTAHVALLEIASRVPGVASAAALLSTNNVAKGVFGAGLSDRVAMLLELQRDYPHVAVLATNAARIVDQAEALHAAFPGLEFDFVVGYDTLVRLFDPAYYDDMVAELRPFFARHRVIAANRGEADVAAVKAYLDRPEVRPFAAGVVVCELDRRRAALSSTLARELAANGGDHGETLTRPVARYIAERGLYAGERKEPGLNRG